MLFFWHVICLEGYIYTSSSTLEVYIQNLQILTKQFYGKLCPFNSFHANGLLYLWPLKTLENLFEELKRHSVKSVEMGSFFWSVFSRIQSEYGKIRTRKNSEFRHFTQWDHSTEWVAEKLPNYFTTISQSLVSIHCLMNTWTTKNLQGTTHHCH